jgi:hypothetical protein
LGLVLWAFVPSLTAHAEPAQQAKAKAHVNVGASLYRAERYREALAEFEAAFQLMPRPVVLINIGQCYRKLDDPQHALEAYDRYLAAVGPDDSQRGAVEALVVAMKDQIAHQPPRVVPDPPVEAVPVHTPPQVVVAEVPTPAPPPPRWTRKKKLAVGLGIAAGVLVVGGVALGLVFGLPASAPGSGLGNYPVLR